MRSISCILRRKGIFLRHFKEKDVKFIKNDSFCLQQVFGNLIEGQKCVFELLTNNFYDNLRYFHN